MTDKEKILLRKENVRRLFRLTGNEFVREVLDKYRSEDPAPASEICEQYDVSTHELMGSRWYKIRAKGVVPGGKTEKILYLHGGGFVLETGAAEYLYAGYLSEQTGAEVWFPEYPLAPEYSCVEALEMVTELYRLMLKGTESRAIAMMGSSAGGGVAVSSAMHFRETGLSMPNNLILYSPAVELSLPETEADKEYLAILEQRDSMVSYLSVPTVGKLWRGSLGEGDYRWNPVCGDFHGLPPILLFTGTGEVLNLAARHFADAAKAQGVEIQYYEKEMMQHCWILFLGEDNQEERKIVVERLLK